MTKNDEELQENVGNNNKRLGIMNNPHKVLPQLLVGVVGTWGCFCMGLVRGWSSPGMPSLHRTMNGTIEMDSTDTNWITSLPMFGAVFGALLIGVPMQLYGRKWALVGHYLLFIIGFLLIGFAYFIRHKAMLYTGRFLSGVGNGMTTPASQIYVAECSSPRIRGRLGSLTASSLALGILVTYILGAFVEWHVTAWIYGCIPIGFLAWMALMPETPVWLLTKDKEDKARASLQRLRGKRTDVEGEMTRMKENVQNKMSAEGEQKIKLRDLMAGPILKPLGISLGIMFFQQTTGVNAMIFYTVSLFEDAGSTLDGRYATIIVGIVQLIFTVASGFLVDRYGRRILLLTSSVFVTISLAALGTFFRFQLLWGEAEATERLGWLPLVSLIVFFIAYSGGMANVPLIIMGEMFPSRYRTVLGTITSSFSLLCTFLIVRCYPDLLSGLGKDGTFYLFTCCTLFSIGFVYFFLPETKGKTLEEMEKLFGATTAHQQTSDDQL